MRLARARRREILISWENVVSARKAIAPTKAASAPCRANPLEVRRPSSCRTSATGSSPNPSPRIVRDRLNAMSPRHILCNCKSECRPSKLLADEATVYVLQIIGLDEYRHRMDTRVERLGRRLEDAGVFKQLDATKAIGPINRSAAHCLEDGPHRTSISAVRRHLAEADTMNGCLPIQRTAARENGAVDIRRERPPACLRRDDGQRRLPGANQPAAFVRSRAENDTIDSKGSIRPDKRNSRCLSLRHARSQRRTP